MTTENTSRKKNIEQEILMKKYPGYSGINQERMEPIFTLTADTDETYSYTLSEAIAARENGIVLTAHRLWNGELINDDY